MFLSKVWIAWPWADNPYQLHRALWQLFPHRPKDTRDFLFRVEGMQQGRGANVLLQSAYQPKTAELVACVEACKSFHCRIESGQLLRFRLRANPVKTIQDGFLRRDGRGEIKRCRVPLLHEEQRLQWLARKLGEGGQLQSVRVVDEPTLYFRKSGQGGKIQPVNFEGLMTVRDSEQLTALLVNGIGPGKSMGCGLLSLASA